MTLLRVATFNIQHFETAAPSQVANFVDKKIDCDVLCIQEEPLHAMPLPSQIYTRVVQSVDTSMTSDDKNVMSNSIYVQSLHNIEALQRHNALNKPFDVEQRSASLIKQNGILIANVHLTGGRYDDYTVAPKLPGIKAYELRQLFSVANPDLIVGDFNGERNAKFVARQLSDYDAAKNAPDEKLFSFYYTSAHLEMARRAFVSPINEWQIGRTSVYGGVPDWIYYNPQRLSYVKDSLHKIDATGISDHNALCATFAIKL